ncbi:MAG: hypothetical protein LBQ34_07470 [Alphaproteobacteria bacterium]|jgi:hypothetical protein|nr:hypothetical protein [Alphaproteobacteria bacterium]
MLRFIIFLIIIFPIGQISAEVYFSAGAGLNQNSNLSININSAPKLFQDNTVSQEVDIGNICTQCPNFNTNADPNYPNHGVDLVDVYKTITINNNYSQAGNNLEIMAKSQKMTPSYNIAIGYKFLNNFRLDAEFRATNLTHEFNEILGDISNNQTISYEYSCQNHSEISEGDYCYYESLNYDSTNQVNFRGNLLNFTSYNVASSVNNRINYYFINFFYDTDVVFNIGFFGGGGFGQAQINLKTTSNLPLSLNGKVSTYAYQYKIGTFYNINGNENIRLNVSLTHINTVGKIKFSNLEMNPIAQNSVDFFIMLIP